MHNLRRFYYQNKTQILKVIALIAFIIIIIQVVNFMVKVKNEANVNNNSSNVYLNQNKTNTNTNSNVYMSSDKSLTTGEQIDSQLMEQVNNIIEEFVDACNSKDIEKAYNLLSDECKEELYPNKTDFENRYIKYNFDGEFDKIAQIENWSEDIYKVMLKEDLMSTGKVSTEAKQDYITITKQNGELKINTNGFIGTEKIDSSNTQDGITITALEKKLFMDYEEYTIRIENRTENKILLDTLESTKTIYLQDINEMKYYSHSNEIVKKLLEIQSGASTQLKIKFSRSYNTTKINSIVFSDLVLNYNDYLSGDAEKQIFILYL